MEPRPLIVRSQAGIKRDGTRYEGENYIDGRWCRWHRRLPRKMGGYRSITRTLPEVVYGMTSFTENNLQYPHLGSASFLTQVVANSNGVFSSQNDRTPVGFLASPNNLWQFDTIPGFTGGASRLIAHAAPNLNDISSSLERDIYVGQASAPAALVASALDPQSGGVVSLNNFIMTYGNAGRVDVTEATDPILAGDTAFITGQKIIKALPLRGSGTGPSAILWSLDSVLRATFDPTISSGIPFRFDTLTSESSILSSQGVVEYDGIYFWAGVDRFLMFNGVVREVPNEMNLNFFFDNVNMQYRQKVFVFKVPRWGEIWWCFPFGNATECTHAVIYNVRENTWYDTELPRNLRSAGIFAKVYARPFMTDTVDEGTGYTLWQHETGMDEVLGFQTNAIQSYFETSEISMMIAEQSVNKSIRIARMEDDFVQSGNMSIVVRGRANARAPLVDSAPIIFPDQALTVSDQVQDMKENRRLMSFRFESNVAGGHYEMGQILAHIEPTDGRVTG